MSKSVALFYARDGIRANSVHPGSIGTPMVESFLAASGNPEGERGALDAPHPLGHIGEADDVAYGIPYFASDESAFVAGSEQVIDGGSTAR